MDKTQLILIVLGVYLIGLGVGFMVSFMIPPDCPKPRKASDYASITPFIYESMNIESKKYD